MGHPGLHPPDCDRANITIGLALLKWLPESQKISIQAKLS